MTRIEQAPHGFEEQLLMDLKGHIAQQAETTSAAGTVGRRTRFRRGWRLAGAFGLAIALTAGGLAVQTMGVGDRPPSAANAAEIFRLAADVARRQPELSARPDQYVFTETLSTVRETPGSGPYLTVRTQLWQSAGGIAHSQRRYRPETEPNGWSELEVYRPNDPADPDRELDEFPSPAYHGDLPADPDELLRYLRDHPVDLHLPEGADAAAGYGSERMPYNTVRSMLRGYVPPRALAALFELLAREPGATVLPGDVVDAAGRRGVAIRFSGSIGGHNDLIFDRDTHVHLGARLSVVRDGTESVDSSVAYLRVAIVDRPGQLP